MKLAWTWYYCGLGLILLGTGMLIYGVMTDAALVGIAKGIWALLLGSWWMRIGSRKIKEAKGTSVEESSKKLQDSLEILSCPTCDFFNKQTMSCEVPNGPDIENNYCHTFTHSVIEHAVGKT